MLVPLLILAILLLVLLEGFFSGSETVLTSASKTTLHDLAERGDSRAILARDLISRTERFLGTTLTGTNLAVVSSTTLAQFLLARYAPGAWETLLNTIIMTPLILVVGELLPKSLGRAHADQLSLVIVRPLLWAEKALFPVVVVTSAVARRLVSLVSGNAELELTPSVTREDLRAIAELAVEQNVLPEATGSMLCTVFDLDTKSVDSIMVPLVDVASVPLTALVGDVEDLASKRGFTRLPVYEERVDNIVGVVDLRELLYAAEERPASEERKRSIRPFVHHNIIFVPETKAVGSLLHELRYHHIPMAGVVDEHGGVVGVVTTEDLLEEVVGEMRDERDADEQMVRHVEESVFDCEGRLSITELREHLNVDMDAEGFGTVAGLILKLAGHIPVPGERFECDEFDVEVLEVDRRRVARVRFRRKNVPDS
ncbi:MAG: HlyC/CorC family transporter [Lentisphaerae bacterium]|jgi:putative hemolysin|nr:HlyC/CorC family transporter [Lentisphaerota bacterium]MBT4816470.1 HlyC/CorC family transporter [Lentisphaerota bacterium]MBT5609278.1 HlyC/CorC family transporter [Lentisphaerota bacterium]MBT7059428.1 HlyC/CorC family transporter [Lentisphaerota bacterium]MBT7847812.1 HlyC/CorC family transporter [Lentisphaerota bacterium]